MDYPNYLQHISFRLYFPTMYPKGFTRISKILQKFNFSLEVLNTRIPDNATSMRKRLVPLLDIPRFSTFAIGALINEGVSRLADDSCFLNIGVWHGFTFLAGIMENADKRCIGVDNFSEFDAPRQAFMTRFESYKCPCHAFYDMDYKEYFQRVHTGKIGFYLYDGNHHYEDQYNALKIAEPFFSENCIILIDDANRRDPRQATLNFIEKSAQKYQIILDKKTCIEDHPTFWNGILVVQKVT